MKRIGVYAGSFDPVHNGHIVFAKEAARQCSLETVLFIPEKLPPNKPHISPLSERTAELSYALTGTGYSVVSLNEDRARTHSLLALLSAQYPDTTYVFLVGSDVALTLPYWEDIALLVAHVEFVVGMRSTETDSAVHAVLDTLGCHYTLLKTRHTSVSSTGVRASRLLP